MQRVDQQLDLERTTWELLTRPRRVRWYSAFHTRGKAFAWALLGSVAAVTGGILLVMLLLG